MNVVLLILAVVLFVIAFVKPPDIASVSLTQKPSVAVVEVVEWEHGFKTDRVIATRYHNKSFGTNIGFKFPQDPYNCDRTEIMDCIREHGGYVYQCGGYPGAEVFAVFDGVRDKDAASEKIREIIPALSELMASL